MIAATHLRLSLRISLAGFLLAVGLAGPAFAQNQFSVVEIYNATDGIPVHYEVRWGQNGRAWDVADQGHNYHYYPYAYVNQNSSPTPTIAFESGIGRVRGTATYELEAFASPDKDKGGNGYVFVRRPDTQGVIYLDVLKLNTYLVNNRKAISQLMTEKKYDQAIAHCDTALKIKFDDALTINLRGRCYQEKGEAQLALNDFTLAMIHDNDDPSFPNNRGYALLDLGKYDMALVAFETAIRLKASFPNAYGGRGLARAYLGNEAGAREDFAREIQLDPTRTLRTLPKPVVETTSVKPNPNLNPNPPARPYLKEYEPYIAREAFENLEAYRLGSKVDAAENARLQVAYNKAFEESRYNDVQEANHIRAIQREPVAALWKMLADPAGNHYFLPSFTPVEERLDGMKRPLVGGGSDKLIYVKSNDDLSGLRIAVRRNPNGRGDGGLQTAAILPLRWTREKGVVPLNPPDNLRVLIRLKDSGEHMMLGMSFTMTSASGGGFDLRPEIYTSPAFGMDRFNSSTSSSVSPRGCMDCHAVGFNIGLDKYTIRKEDRAEFAATVRKMPGFDGFLADVKKNGATDEQLKNAALTVARPDLNVMGALNLKYAVLKLWNAIYFENQPYLDNADGRFIEYNESYGSAWLDAGDLDKALAHFDKAISRSPDSPTVYLKRAAIYTQKNRREDVAKDLDQALKIDPKNPFAFILRSNLRLLETDFRRAWEDADQAVFLSPTASGTYLARSKVSILKGDARTALVDIDRAILLEPTSIEALNAKAWLLATSPVDEVRNGSEAVKVAQRASELVEGKSSVILDTLAAAYAESGDFAKALASEEKALADPTLIKQVGELEVKLARDRLQLYREHRPFREKPARP